MKTKLVPWWENWVRYFVFISLLLAGIVVMSIGMQYVVTDHSQLALQGKTFWTYEVDSRFGMVPYWTIATVTMSFIAPLLGTVLFFAPNIMLTPRRTLFKHEIKLGLVPTIGGQPFAFPKKEFAERYEWIEPFEFEGKMFPDGSNGEVYAWGENPKTNGVHMVRKNTFFNNIDDMENGYLEGTWTWKWNRIDFVETVLVKLKPVPQQLELDLEV